MGIFQRLKKDQPAKPEPAKPTEVQAKSMKVASISPKVAAGKIILKPVITEKSSMSGTYQFMIASQANRVEVAKAFTELYKKVPRKVNIMKVRGKSVRFGSNFGKRASWKKAVVYLNKGESIDLYSE